MRIAEGENSESAPILNRGPDDDYRREFAAALSAVAGELAFGVPLTAPETKEVD